MGGRDSSSGTRPASATPVAAGLFARTFSSEEIDAVKLSLGQTKDLAHSAQAQFPRILELMQKGLGVCAIGRKLNISHQAVSRALANEEPPVVCPTK